MAKERTRNETPVFETIFLRDMEITGEINVTGDLVVMGKINGNISCTGTVTVTEGAVVRGDITGSEADVDGLVNGNIRAVDFTLRENARIEGRVEALKYRIFGGKIDVSVISFSA